jgi:hypothetical protein
MNDAVLSTFKTGDIPGWEDFLACFPANWREIAKATNVLKGQRKDKEPDKLMHVLMLHLLCGYSLRETSAIAAASGIASLTHLSQFYMPPSRKQAQRGVQISWII